MFGFMLVPLYRTLRWSLQKVTYGEPGVEVGLANYAEALSDPRLGKAVLFTASLTAVVSVLRGAGLRARGPGERPGQDAAGRLGHHARFVRASARGGCGGLLLAVRLELRRPGELPDERPHRRCVR